jgi:hypothetical protein
VHHHHQQQYKHTFFVIQIFWGFAPAYIFASYLARKPNKLFAALYKHTHTQLVEEKKKSCFGGSRRRCWTGQQICAQPKLFSFLKIQSRNQLPE